MEVQSEREMVVEGIDVESCLYIVLFPNVNKKFCKSIKASCHCVSIFL